MQTFQEFLINQQAQLSIADLLINLCIALVLSYILEYYYIKYGKSLSNRKTLGNNFILITLTTTLIITIVKSSLALSLGLVGALSIVRFRAAIKEPEELAYLFLCIAIGLGCGASQRVPTIVSFVIIIIILFLKNILPKTGTPDNMFINISSSSDSNNDLVDNIIEILKEKCSLVELKRIDYNDKIIETAFLVEYTDYKSVLDTFKKIKNIPDIKDITILESKIIN